MINFSINTFWRYMWHLHYQVKDVMMIHKWIRKQVIAFQSAGGDSTGSDKVVGGVSLEEIIPTGSPGPEEGRGEDKGVDDYGLRQRIGLFLGPLLFVLTLFMPTPEGMSPDAQRILAGTIWMATWWITEAIPIPVTSLLPIVLFPITGAMGVGQVTAPYANPNVFLFLGGFMIAVCMEKWNLHRRIALLIINFVGTSPNRLVLGFMAATGFLSMWISNTATTMMMLPIGLAEWIGMQLSVLEGSSMLIIMLPVATPPNAVIFGSGYITIPQMARAGMWLNILAVIIITLFAYFWLPFVFGF